MNYLTFAEYLYIGGKYNDETAFNRHILRACGVIRNETHSRVDDMAVTPDEVKACCRDLIDYMQSNDITDHAVTSHTQTAGAVSESESYAQADGAVRTADMQSIVYDYLAHIKDEKGTPLLYRGCNP